MQFTNEGDVQATITNPSIAVTGPLTDIELRATPVPVTIPTPVPVVTGGSGTATVSRVSVGIVVSTLKVANSSRIKVIIHNEVGTLFVKLGTGASDTDYSYRLTANTVIEIEGYTGILTGLKATGSSFAQVTEY